MEKRIEYTSLCGEKSLITLVEAKEIIQSINKNFDISQLEEKLTEGWSLSYNDHIFVLKK